MKLNTPILVKTCYAKPEIADFYMDEQLKDLDSYEIYNTALYDLKTVCTVSNYYFDCFLLGENLVLGDAISFVERIGFACVQLTGVQYYYNDFNMTNETAFLFDLPNEINEFQGGISITVDNNQNTITANMSLKKAIESFNKLKYRQINLN